MEKSEKVGPCFRTHLRFLVFVPGGIFCHFFLGETSGIHQGFVAIPGISQRPPEDLSEATDFFGDVQSMSTRGELQGGAPVR